MEPLSSLPISRKKSSELHSPPVVSSFVPACQRWMAWWMRIIQRNAQNSVAKAVLLGIRICKAYAPTALPMDYAAEIMERGQLTRAAQNSGWDSPESHLPLEVSNCTDGVQVRHTQSDT